MKDTNEKAHWKTKKISEAFSYIFCNIFQKLIALILQTDLRAQCVKDLLEITEFRNKENFSCRLQPRLVVPYNEKKNIY